MIIEVWSDFVCPFCYIGKRRLEDVINEFPHKEQVEVHFKSFELDPNAPVYSGKSIHEAIAEKYGLTLEQAKRSNEEIGSHAAEVGLTFQFENMKPTNTFLAHRLAKFAKTLGKEKEITEKLLYAYFTESKHIGDVGVLADIAESAGIDREEALNILHDEKAFANDVRIEEGIASQYGIRGVPYFVINQKYAISGAQPKETFVNALNKVWEEEKPKIVLQDLSASEGVTCTDEGCAIPEKRD